MTFLPTDKDWPLVYILTLNWNRPLDTLNCLDSLSRSTYVNRRIVCIDNGSWDESPRIIKNRFPEVRQIINARNLGFGAGFNVGLRLALQEGADFIFLLNNDTVVAENTIELLVRAAESTDFGFLSPLVYYASSPDKVWSSGAFRSKWTLDLMEPRGKVPKNYLQNERDFLTGCAMFLRRSVLERVGFFDEDFFLYYEDSDYAERVRQAGFRLLLVPEAHIWHKVSTSSEGADSPMERYWMARSSILFYRKHVRGRQWLAVVPWRLGSGIKKTFFLLAKGKLKSAKGYWRGIFDGIRSVTTK